MRPGEADHRDLIVDPRAREELKDAPGLRGPFCLHCSQVLFSIDKWQDLTENRDEHDVVDVDVLCVTCGWQSWVFFADAVLIVRLRG